MIKMSSAINVINELGSDHPIFKAMCERIFTKKYFSGVSLLRKTRDVSILINELIDGTAIFEKSGVNYDNGGRLVLSSEEMWILKEICAYFSIGFIRISGKLPYLYPRALKKYPINHFYNLLFDVNQKTRVYSYAVLCGKTEELGLSPWLIGGDAERISLIERHQCAYIAGRCKSIDVLESLQKVYGNSLDKTATMGVMDIGSTRTFNVERYLVPSPEKQDRKISEILVYGILFIIYTALLLQF